MRLSLRTLLAYEDKVFDIEQQRQLEKLIQKDDASVLTLRRIRGIIRQPDLGVPGKIQQREELDPNVVAEYIDEEMQPEVQERFEKFCLSSDKFLAEVASIHQILSNVLGEPARTSRECRLRCYGANRRKYAAVHEGQEARFFDPEPAIKPEVVLMRSTEHSDIPSVRIPVEKPKYQPEEIITETYTETLVEKPNVDEKVEKNAEKTGKEKKNSFAFWGFVTMLIFPAGFLLGMLLFPSLYEWVETPKRPVFTESPPMDTLLPIIENPAVKVVSPPLTETTPFIPPVSETMVYSDTQDTTVQRTHVTDKKAVASAVLQGQESVESIQYRESAFESNRVNEPFLSTVIEKEPYSSVTLLPSKEPQQMLEKIPLRESESPTALPMETFDSSSLVAFQPITAPPIRQKIIDFDGQRRLEAPNDRHRNRHVVQEHVVLDSVVAAVPVPAPLVSEWVTVPKRVPSSVVVPESVPQEVQSFVSVGQINETAAVESTEPSEKSVGRIPYRSESLIVFSANSSSDRWELKPLPFNIFSEQYLLTLAPFRTELEWDNGLLIEMVGDAKLCALPPDENGISGIYVDYGRIVIRQKTSERNNISQPSRLLRIQTENIDGILQLNGSRSSAFIDTFAEVQEAGTSVELSSRSNRIVPILGLLPESGHRVTWQISGQQELISAVQNGSVQLLPNTQELGGIQDSPVWLQYSPLPKEAETFADVCRRIFQQHRNDSEASLEELSRDTSPLIRSFGLRLWGDLGRFEVPLAFLENSGQNDDSIRPVLVSYFREVMKRDSESVQRLSDAMEAAKKQ